MHPAASVYYIDFSIAILIFCCVRSKWLVLHPFLKQNSYSLETGKTPEHSLFIVSSWIRY